MSRRILLAESALTTGLLAFALAERARIRRVGAYVVIDRQPVDPTADVATAPKYTGPKVGRNEPCPCGSGAKFKKCCLR